jgi:hypothetical protein
MAATKQRYDSRTSNNKRKLDHLSTRQLDSKTNAGFHRMYVFVFETE